MKKLLVIFALIAICSGAVFAFGKDKTNTDFVLLPTMQSKTDQQNRAWVGTFQLVWNDFQNNIVKGSVKFEGDEKNQTAKELNKQKFKADQISANSYYKTFGLISPDLKTQIETALMKKFNETSDITGMIDWTPSPDKYLFYSMLKKDFKFFTPFDKLTPARFSKFPGKVEYFGISPKSDSKLDDMVRILFYNSRDDFAVSIKTEGKDVVYLYRTDDNKTFDKLYRDMMYKERGYMGWHDFLPKDELRVPNLNLYKMQKYPELTKKQIKGTDMMIDEAIQTLQFTMNNEGVKLKSEAAMIAKNCALVPDDKKQAPRKCYFDDTFVVFLQEYDRKAPYFALRVYDLNLINSTGKPTVEETEDAESTDSGSQADNSQPVQKTPAEGDSAAVPAGE